jgi:hypothetical protein
MSSLPERSESQIDDFRFEPKAHVYTLNGKPMHGVTSILGVISKPALVPWAARMAVEYIKENSLTATSTVADADGRPEEVLNYYKVYEETLDEAKNAHRKKKEDEAEKGTDVHALVEEWVGLCIEYNAGEPKLVFQLAERMYILPSAIDAFARWATKEKIRFIASEQRLYSKQLWVAGTCDLIFEKDGKRYIGDIKTYKKIWDRVPLIQCAGYALMWEEMQIAEQTKDLQNGDIIVAKQIDGYCVIRIKDNEFEAVWSGDPEGDKQAFLAAVTLYKALKNWGVAEI